MNDMVHTLTRLEIFQRMLAWRQEGRLYDLANPVQDEVFTGCVDRFADIAFRLRGCRKVLDVGAEPILYKGMSFYPVRHNHKFTAAELRLLFEAAGFRNIRGSYLNGRRYREGAHRFLSAGTMLRDAVPSLRKFLIAFAKK